jgi:UDP-3-O-[3-hydroxymyristoyl] glucosamine N-acyltransferase
MKVTLAQVAELVGGVLRGDGALVIEGAARLSEATSKDISFLGNPKYESQMKSTQAGALLVPPGTDTHGRPAVELKNPPYGWAKILELLDKDLRDRPRPGVHPSAVVAPTAVLGEGVSVGPCAVIEDRVVIGAGTVVQAHGFIGHDARIGRDCFFHPRVTIRERVVVGDRCIVQPGAVIGCDGFGFTFHQGRHYKVPQVGTVELGDDVEIQANTTIDRAAVGATKIGRGTKIDNLVQIAHNVEIGEDCLIVALTGVAGSAKLGRYVTLAAQVGVAGHLTIGDQVQVGGKAGVTGDVKSGEVLWGLPAHPLKDEMKTIAAARRLPRLMDDLKAIKKKLGL